MSENGLSLLLLLGVALAVPAGMLALSALAGPRRRANTDLTPYECGSHPFHSARRQFAVQFYLIGMLFIIFDVELVFLLPWAVELKKVLAAGGPGLFVLVEMLVFFGILLAGYVYIRARGALDWER